MMWMTKKLSLNFLGMAIVYFLAATVLGTLMLGEIVTPTKMLKTAHTHIALLGWVSATIIGTMYQQVPTLTAADLHSKKMARASFWLFNVGVVAMFLTFVSASSSAPVLSASLVMLGVLLFAYNILMTLKNRKGDSQVLKFYGAAVVYFVLASALGMLMLVGYKKGLIVTAHAHLALLGWVSLLIMGAMAWMFPMMVMRDLQRPRILDVVFWLFNIGTIGLFAGFVFQGYGTLTKASGAIVGLSVLLFAYQMLLTTTAKSKMPQAPKSTEAKFFKAAIFYFAAATLLGVLMLFGKWGYITGIKTLHVHIALIGFVSVTIFGGFYHVIPMLVWTLITEKLQGGGVRGPSSFKELYSDGLAMAIFVLVNAGVVGLFFGLALSMKALGVASAIAITASGVIFAGDMLRMILKS
jgi:cbb3-type cytochrome oxidase subunit 1